MLISNALFMSITFTLMYQNQFLLNGVIQHAVTHYEPNEYIITVEVILSYFITMGALIWLLFELKSVMK